MKGNRTEETAEQYTSRLVHAIQGQREITKLQRAVTKEPQTVSYTTESEVATTPLEDDPIDQIENLLENAAVLRIEPCFSTVTTAAQVAGAVVAHPQTLTTKVRIHYEDKDERRHLPFFEVNESRQEQLKTALAQFISVFTEDAENESLNKDELFDTFCRWFKNLTGSSVSRSQFGRTLNALNTERNGEVISDRNWVNGVVN